MLPRLPLAVTNFRELLPSADVPEGHIYVDKTPAIRQMLDGPRCQFLIRPRRFGKSLLVSTLASLFRGEVETFQHTWIRDHWHWEQETRPVLHLSLGIRNVQEPAELQQRLCRYLWWHAGEVAPAIFNQNQPVIPEQHVFRQSPDEMLAAYLAWIYAQQIGTPRGLVVLVDEYDVPVNENLDSESARAITDVMRAFYGAIKDCSHPLRFVFVTGIARFARTGLFSGANQLTDISDWPSGATLLGIAHDDLTRGVLRPWLDRAAANMNMEPEQLGNAFAQHYNGYRFAPKGMAVYNPWSLLQCLHYLQNAENARATHPDRLPNFWAESGNTALLERVFLAAPTRQEAINVLESDPVSESQEEVKSIVRTSYDVRSPDVTALLYQTGYLTHAEQRDHTGMPETFLDFPNEEIAQTFYGPLRTWLRSLVVQDSEWQPLQTRRWREIWQAGRAQDLYRACNQYLRQIPYPLFPRRDRVTVVAQEYFYQALLYGWTSVLGLQPLAEVTTHHGRADLIAADAQRIWVIEIKLRESAAEAVRQALLRGYTDRYISAQVPVTVIGIQVSAEYRLVKACAIWHLGQYDPIRQCWEQEPFRIPLAEIRIASDQPLPDWPLPTELDLGIPRQIGDPGWQAQEKPGDSANT